MTDKVGVGQLVKLLIGAGGIYGAFLYYGTLQEDVFKFVSADGEKFKASWFLQVMETIANVVVAFVGRLIFGGTSGAPMLLFGFSGITQVSAKAFTSMALANGVSFPIVTLAKSGKSLPVMVGSLLVGKASYSLQEYLACIAIVAGTCMVSFGSAKSAKAGASTTAGLLFIALSLTCDGITGGLQNRMKADLGARDLRLQPYDYMLFTNLFMMLTAVAISVVLDEFQPGLAFCLANAEILEKVLKFALCSAVGQSFIFFTIATFDPLVCSTVTTTRKIFSVLLSIFLHGHAMSAVGWAGIALASCGILAELLKHAGPKHKTKEKETTDEDSSTKVANKRVEAAAKPEEEEEEESEEKSAATPVATRSSQRLRSRRKTNTG